MKKKIFVMMTALYIGGAERALIGLLNSVDYTKYDVDLFLLEHQGEFLELVPKEVNLLQENQSYAAVVQPLKRVFKNGRFLVVAGRLKGKRKAKKFERKNTKKWENMACFEYSHKYTVKHMPVINAKTTYDLAISFIMPHYFVANKVNAKKKIAWIHTDYSKNFLDVESELAMWSAYDYIGAISHKAAEAFSSVFPRLTNKLVVIENILSPDFVRKQSQLFAVTQEMPCQSGVVNILSIGRFCYAKNFEGVPELCKYILENGYKIKWYIIGFGGGEEKIREQIKIHNMEQTVIILGKKENPYPYINACDIYIQPSRYEGKAVAVREAQVLGKPVVITDFPTASSQLENGVDGLIVSSEKKICAQEICALIKDTAKREQLSKMCLSRNYGNGQEVEKIYQIIN